MSLKALITTIVVGTSAVAAAHPVTFDHGDRPAVRDHRFGDRDHDAGRYERFRDRSWWRLARWHHDRRAPVQVGGYVGGTFQGSYGYDDDYAQPCSLLGPTALGGHLKVDVPQRGVRTIRFQTAGSGSSYVEEVTIVYREGRAQVVDIDQTLDPRNPAYDLAVGPGVAEIIVEGTSQPGGVITAEAF